MAVPSLLNTSSNKSSFSKFGFFANNSGLCAIAEDSVLSAMSPRTSIMSVPKKKLSAKAPAFVPKITLTAVVTPPTPTVTTTKLGQFTPCHKPRAKLNIYIGKPITKEMLLLLSEPFSNTSSLYNYLDVSTALQMTDGQMHVFQKDSGENISFINFDLHKKGTQEIIYGIVSENDKSKVGKDQKWVWKMDEVLTAEEILDKYNVRNHDLPKSSRLMLNGVNDQLQKQKKHFDLSVSVINDMEFSEFKNIAQFMVKSKKNKKFEATVLSESAWMNGCNESWDDLKAIPVVLYENSKYWIEWVKVIHIKEQNSHIGLSFRKRMSDDSEDSQWSLRAIYLDKNDILNKNRLCDCSASDYNEYFDKFDICLNKIGWEN